MLEKSTEGKGIAEREDKVSDPEGHVYFSK